MTQKMYVFAERQREAGTEREREVVGGERGEEKRGKKEEHGEKPTLFIFTYYR